MAEACPLFLLEQLMEHVNDERHLWSRKASAVGVPQFDGRNEYWWVSDVLGTCGSDSRWILTGSR